MSLQCLIIIILQVMSMQLLIVEKVIGQNLKATLISAKMKRQTLEQIFKGIESKSDYVFVFPSDVKDDEDTYSFHFREESLENVLIQLRKTAKLK
ncbi:MAG TPA: hypothetical protein VK666_29045, partial [Chryseolinea sp.]|nr:hypothetical protein [Chryseolinea sp.]